MEIDEALREQREQLDEIDRQLRLLFLKRMQIVEEVAQIKQMYNLPVYDPDRENKMIEKHCAAVEEDERGDMALFIRMLTSLSRNRQQRKQFSRPIGLLPQPSVPADEDVVCAYQGLPGAWGKQAADKLYPVAEKRAFPQFEDVFCAVRDGVARYGVIPIENSQTGAITETYDLLRKYGCFIVGRTDIDIRQCLLASACATLDSVRQVYSHPEALKQCRRFLKDKPWEQMPSVNTAIAASEIAQEKNPEKAAIASREAASTYGLSILVEDIMDANDNQTSFIAIARAPEYDADSSLITLTFSLLHQSGALCESLMPLMANKINLLRIESRPAKESGSYRFFVDLQGNWFDCAVQQALAHTAACCTYFEVLGAYKLR